MCIGCFVCESVCKYNVMKIRELSESILGMLYIIDDIKCVWCGECINYFEGGCYMRKVLVMKRGE